MDYKVITGLIVAAVFAFVGFLVKEWTAWTSSTLIDLNARTSVMESEIKNTNQMVAQNYEMLKFLVNKTQKARFNDKPWTDDVPSYQASAGEN